IFPVHVAVSEFQSAGKRFFTGVIRDVSDLKAVHQQLRQANAGLEQRVQEKTEELKRAQAGLLENARLATLGQVSGGIAHEIRNPLNAVKTSVYYLLNARNLTEAKMREHLERIDRQVTVMDNVLTALTDVALMPEPSLQPLEIRKHVQEVIGQIGLPTSIQVINEIPPDLKVVVRADVHQFPIVLRNLLRNARDAMPEGGTIRIGLRQSEAEIALDVCDQGEGIRAEHLPHVTEPFFSTKSRGMGLGLAISKAILEKNGGRLEIQSQPGLGSTFSMVFPLATSEERA
ncbi:MAG: ATP-binding protein, partial [bacterium]|nr:ATP-binding protein [bacterium]